MADNQMEPHNQIEPPNLINVQIDSIFSNFIDEILPGLELDIFANPNLIPFRRVFDRTYSQYVTGFSRFNRAKRGGIIAGAVNAYINTIWNYYKNDAIPNWNFIIAIEYVFELHLDMIPNRLESFKHDWYHRILTDPEYIPALKHCIILNLEAVKIKFTGNQPDLVDLFQQMFDGVTERHVEVSNGMDG
jgi:hypothetical protein